MAFAGASLADGGVAGTFADLYVSSGVKTIVRSVSFYNTSATPQTLEVRILRSGSTARLWHRVTLAINETAELLTDGEVLVMSTGDQIEAQSTTASVVLYTITGATE